MPFLSPWLYALLCAVIIDATQALERHFDVLILGGGMAGISAAQSLQSAGYNKFLVLEQADRLGGRIHDVEFAGVRIEEVLLKFMFVFTFGFKSMLLVRVSGCKLD